MQIYFIRHGQTEYNRRRMHQDGTVPLTEAGRTQILKAAEALKRFPITKVISSDFARAVESGDIIGRTLGLVPEQNPLFREVRRPSSLYGKKFISAPTLLAGASILFHLHDKDWHYSDEENLFDLKERIREAVEYLTAMGKEHEHIAVVSHGFVIALFIKYMCAYKDVRVSDYLKTFLTGDKLRNASISTVAFAEDENPLTCDWMLTDINNTKHLR